ncbi:MAG: hypothetical protein JSS49_16590 [Planctomycetes bacterium]|nr:hypothetical protein [Planctomycetota bacterium]
MELLLRGGGTFLELVSEEVTRAMGCQKNSRAPRRCEEKQEKAKGQSQNGKGKKG